MFFQGLAGCARERKRYQTNIKYDTQTRPEMDKQRCRIYARKSDAKMMETNVKLDPKGTNDAPDQHVNKIEALGFLGHLF